MKFVSFFVLGFFNVLQAQNDKYRVCVVDGKGGFKRASKYCPILDHPQSPVECVIGIDRLDCLRRISKGTVDFSVFSPEDLVTAINSEVEVLISNEMRFIPKDKYEYSVVSVISDESGIKSRHDLKNKHFCHPGYGYETDWTNILANYLEATIIPQSCNPKLTMAENRIVASSKFFKSACKAGPWARDPTVDEELKKKYSNLCDLCNSQKCDSRDKYSGRRGPLYCLTDGGGDISWARLSDVEAHFGFEPGKILPEGYSFLCPDDTIRPINYSTPCVWIVKPWPVIAAKRKRAQGVRDLLSKINQDSPNFWQSALINLIEKFKQYITPLEPVQPIETYLDSAQGFLSANSFSGCHPPRTIRVCTTSNIANAKCGWLRETASVYGIEPDLECIKASNYTHCMDAIKYDAADIVFIPPDEANIGIRAYKLKSILYETVDESYQYLTVAIVKKTSSINTLEDLKGAKACFPNYDGVAWNSVANLLNSKGLFSKCPFTMGFSEFFGHSCVPGLPKNSSTVLNSLCEDEFNGEYGVIKCLTQGDVGFMSKNSFEKFFTDNRVNDSPHNQDDFKILCLDGEDPCHISWAPVGQGMVSTNKSDMWIKETVNVFLQLDELFGKSYKSVTVPFNMYGIFDDNPDILFHDTTRRMRNVPIAFNHDKIIRHYDDIIYDMNECISSSTSIFKSILVLVITLSITNMLF